MLTQVLSSDSYQRNHLALRRKVELKEVENVTVFSSV